MGNTNSPCNTIKLSDYRYPGEVRSLLVTFAVIALFIALAILVFPNSLLSILNVLAVTLAGVCVYVLIVLIQQRTALGTLVRISPRQFTDIHALATKAAERLSMLPVPVYVERSANMNIYPLGLRGKPLIVVTSAMIDQLDNESLHFLIARELSHIQAGHTWLRVLLKPLGSDVAVIGKLFNSVIFGDWVNRSQLTADRAGFLVCQSLTTSIRAMLKFGVGVNLFNQLDIEEFLKQITDVSNMSGRITELVAGEPYLTQRIRILTEFALSDRIQKLTGGTRTQTRILESLPGSFVQSVVDPQGSDEPAWMLTSLSDDRQYLLGEHTSIGRHTGNDIILNSDSASRFHAEILKQEKGFYLADKASSNGVWLNGRKITRPEKLAAGDRVSFGSLEYIFVRGPGA
jgi:hypothetical protein